MNWYRRFWEEPLAQADFSYWAKVPAWSLEEIVALLLGKDPRLDVVHAYGESPHGIEFSCTHDTLVEIVLRHQAAGELDVLTRSTKVIEWAEKYDFAMPQGLIESVLDREVRWVKKRELSKQWPTVPELEKPADGPATVRMNEHPLEKQSVESTEATSDNELAASEGSEEIELSSQAKRQLANLRALLAAMAISKYNYDPNARKSEVPQILANLLEKRSVRLSAQTIRRHLEAGNEALSKARPEN
jgi:hypothetical protein